MSCYISPFANFLIIKTNNILYVMDQRIPSTPPQKNQQESKYSLSFLQKQFEEVFSKHPPLSLDQAFYLEATKMHVEVLKKIKQVKTVKREIDLLHKELGIQALQRKRSFSSQQVQLTDSNNQERKKRLRRTAVEIARHYTCSIDRCNKSYGSQGSLNQHMKLKHRSYYMKQLLILDMNRNNPPHQPF